MCNTFILLQKKIMKEWIHEHNTLYICMLHFFFFFFSQNSSDNYESGVRTTKEKKKLKKVQVSTSANDKHEERMQR